KTFLTGGTARELGRGLEGSISLDYSRNKNLVNHSSFKFFDKKDADFTSNNPFSPLVETPLFPDYTALTANAVLTYTFGQKYITRPDGKIYQESKSPRIELAYRKGIKNLLDSDVD